MERQVYDVQHVIRLHFMRWHWLVVDFWSKQVAILCLCLVIIYWKYLFRTRSWEHVQKIFCIFVSNSTSVECRTRHII